MKVNKTKMIFLILLVCVVIAAVVLTEIEHFGWATVLLIASVITAQMFGVMSPLTWMVTHALESSIYVLVYVAIGVAWSFVKWFSFLIQFRDQFRKDKEIFLLTHKLDPNGPIPDSLLDAFINRGYSFREFKGNSLNNKPRASNNKSRIVAWMSLWPCSVVGTVLNDPIRRLFNFLFGQFKALYQKMSDHVLRNDAELK